MARLIMKRALLLTYYAPPRPAIATVRTEHLVASLKEHGWEVIPVVPNIGGVEYEAPVRTTGIVEFAKPIRRMLGVRDGQTTHERFHVELGSALEPLNWKQRAIRTGHRMLTFVDGRLGWLLPGVAAVREILRSERIDAIISTSPPVATHLVAARSHGEVPWIADLRDPWLRGDGLSDGPILRAIDELLEGSAFETARALVTVSEPIAQTLRTRFSDKSIYAVTNAFWKREWEDVPFVHPTAATFIHAGSLYHGERNPRLFFEALAQLLHERFFTGDEVRVEFYGDREPWMQEEVEAYGLTGIISLHGKVPRETIRARERAASRLVIVTNEGPEERGTYTGKLFEYLGARRKIIAVGGSDERTVIDDALARTGAGQRYRDVAGLRGAIVDAVEEWRRGETATLSSQAVAPFELSEFGARFAHVLEGVLQL